MLNKAIAIAAEAHDGQVDKGGNPYILHPLRVMMNCKSEAAKICAVLHDVIEDTKVTFEDLKSLGFSDEIVNALDCLTKRGGESYDDFISRVLPNELACQVKLADLMDNMDLTRIQNPCEKDEVRIQRYKLAAERILDVLPYSDRDGISFYGSKTDPDNGGASLGAFGIDDGNNERQPEEVIYCSVSFDGNKTYYYTTDDESIEIGDQVIVPVGASNTELTGEIEDIEYFLPENAPFPLERTKEIIRKVSEVKNEDQKDFAAEQRNEQQSIV